MALVAPVAHARNANLVEFRAGKMTLEANNMVHPDKRKGLVYIIQSEDGLMHFCWKDRNTGAVEENLILFPGDASFTKVSQCTTGRVFLLKIKPQRKLFFWMQEPKSDKDDEHCQKINDLLNHPPTPVANAGLGAGIEGGALPEGFGGGALDSDLLLNALGSMDHNQLHQLPGTDLMGGSGGNLDPSALLAGLASARGPGAGATGAATTTAARSAPASAAATVSASGSAATNASTARRQVVDLAQFQNILSGISAPGAQQQEQNLPSSTRATFLKQSLSLRDSLALLRQCDVSPAAIIAAEKGRSYVQSFAKALESAEGAAITPGEGAAGQAAGGDRSVAFSFNRRGPPGFSPGTPQQPDPSAAKLLLQADDVSAEVAAGDDRREAAAVSRKRGKFGSAKLVLGKGQTAALRAGAQTAFLKIKRVDPCRLAKPRLLESVVHSQPLPLHAESLRFSLIDVPGSEHFIEEAQPAASTDATLFLSARLISVLAQLIDNTFETLGIFVAVQQGIMRIIIGAIVPLHESQCVNFCQMDYSDASLQLIEKAKNRIAELFFAERPDLAHLTPFLCGSFHTHGGVGSDTLPSQDDLLVISEKDSPEAFEVIIAPADHIFSVLKLSPVGLVAAKRAIESEEEEDDNDIAVFESRAATISADFTNIDCQDLPAPYERTPEEMKQCASSAGIEVEGGAFGDPTWFLAATYENQGVKDYDGVTFVSEIRRAFDMKVLPGKFP